jgi:hypothetical protein
MLIDVARSDAVTVYLALIDAVTSRPIAWVTTVEVQARASAREQGGAGPPPSPPRSCQFPPLTASNARAAISSVRAMSASL